MSEKNKDWIESDSNENDDFPPMLEPRSADWKNQDQRAIAPFIPPEKKDDNWIPLDIGNQVLFKPDEKEEVGTFNLKVDYPDREPILGKNMFLVGGNAKGEINIGIPPSGLISKEKALNLAAWLVTLACPTDEEWEKTLEEIQK